MSLDVEPHAEGATFGVRAQPGGRRNAVRGEHDGCLKISVTTAAEKGKANAAILDVLCETLSLRRHQLELLAGETDRRKRFLVRGTTVAELQTKLAAALAAAS
jgi:uncharacterized protein YggU (UPF0235/DUF167 family)